jgi:hypothetical protein
VNSWQKYFRVIPGVLGALSCWWLAITLARVWWTPMAVDHGRWVKLGVGIMVLEFILVHSGAMLPAMAASSKTLGRKPVLLVSALYVLFGAAIALAFKSIMLICTFSGIMIPRWLGILFDSDQARAQQIKRSGMSVMLYLGVAFLSVFVPFPAGGLTPEILNQVYPNRGRGIWEQSPQQALAAGIIYFGVLGLMELIAALKQRATSDMPAGGETSLPFQ